MLTNKPYNYSLLTEVAQIQVTPVALFKWIITGIFNNGVVFQSPGVGGSLWI